MRRAFGIENHLYRRHVQTTSESASLREAICLSTKSVYRQNLLYIEVSSEEASSEKKRLINQQTKKAEHRIRCSA
jgi:hypothetical protein